MPVQPSDKACTHIKVTGVRCGSPALRGEQFCYFHQRMVRGVRTPPNSRLHPIALIESEEAIQASIMEVINALARNTIDLRRAELLLRALHIAVKNSRRTNFAIVHGSMVKEIPNYRPAPAHAVPDSAKEGQLRSSERLQPTARPEPVEGAQAVGKTEMKTQPQSGERNDL